MAKDSRVLVVASAEYAEPLQASGALDGLSGLKILSLPSDGPISAPLLARAIAFTRQHPAAVTALAGVAIAAGPRRLIRWAGVVLPLVMRLRR